MPARRCALLIGVAHYRDDRYPDLPSAAVDVEQMRWVLNHRAIGAFDIVTPVIDPTADQMRSAIEEFVHAARPDDLTLLYLSGHGQRLAATSGEFYFVASDSRPDSLEETAVGAGFFNEQLEACPAPQKVALLDCCESGGFAHGWRVRDETRQRASKSVAPQPAKPFESRGVYLISSSRANEPSLAGRVSADGVEPSFFTANVVKALRTGAPARGDTGYITVADLFHHVSNEMRAAGTHIPVVSALGVDDSIILASCPQGPPPEPPRTPDTSRPHVSATKPRTGSSDREGPHWPRLLEYYRRCLKAETPPATSFLGRTTTKHVVLEGAERLLSGDVDERGCVQVSTSALAFAEQAEAAGQELWAGYPMVTLHGPPGKRPWPSPRSAPLLVRRVRIELHDGRTHLLPFGDVEPLHELMTSWLGPTEAEAFARTYQPTWHAGQHNRMARDIRKLLDELDLRCVQEIRPVTLAHKLDVATPVAGARNAAVLFGVSPEVSVTRGLDKDLKWIAEKSSTIHGTALSALVSSIDGRKDHATGSKAELEVVTPLPCNEAQRAVIESAFAQQLTVATGPPGTGKSQLVVNLVATAVANDKKVLVVSTNNRAVDEVWERCEKLAPGCLIRTGHKANREKAAKALEELAQRELPERNLDTAWEELHLASKVEYQVSNELRHVAELEQDLLRVGRERKGLADKLGMSSAELGHLLGTEQHLQQWSGRLRRVAHARFFGSYRRRRLLGRLGYEHSDTCDVREACVTLAEFAKAEMAWRSRRRELRRKPSDDVLHRQLTSATNDVQTASTELLRTAVLTKVPGARDVIRRIPRSDDRRGSDWQYITDLLPYVRGWAVTSLSARVFKTDPAKFDLVIVDEASQCAIPHIIPLLYRAKHALVIGDPMQLRHITSLPSKVEAEIRESAGISAQWLDDHRLSFRRHSSFDATEHIIGKSRLLDEHYRCHPEIAGIANALFYNGNLTVLTDTGKLVQTGLPAVTWAEVCDGEAERPEEGSWRNWAEIATVREHVDGLLSLLPEEATIGVVTPFVAQVRAIQTRYRDEPRVRVGTVHTFQGGECDAIVFSLVASPRMTESAKRFIDESPNLWNVAISRARARLVVVGNRGLWEARGGVGAALSSAIADLPTLTGTSGTIAPVADDYRSRLYAGLRDKGRVSLNPIVAGHRIDAMVDSDGCRVGYLIDRGALKGENPARHLRQLLARCHLASTSGDLTTVKRLPVWRLYDDQSVQDDAARSFGVT